MFSPNPSATAGQAGAVMRLAAWIGLLIVVTITLGPPDLRPVSGAPHLIEHFAAFLLVGGAFAAGYRQREVALILAAILITAALELLQTLVPGRHARLGDFIVNAVGAAVGVAIVFVLARVRRRGRSLG